VALDGMGLRHVPALTHVRSKMTGTRNVYRP
jgi:hypothetical protein